MSEPFPIDRWDHPGIAVQELFGLPQEEAQEPTPERMREPHHAQDFAQKLYAFEALQPRQIRDPAAEPYSLQWFLDIENQRHSRHGRWIPKLLEFAKHSGESLLGLGHGLGTDWVQYARHGASVIVCSGSAPQLQLVRRNFDLRGLRGRFIHAQPTRLPLDSSSIDVACISSLHHGIDHPEAVIAEVYRVLKPGGKVLAVTPARYDVDYFKRLGFFWARWLGQEKKRHPVSSRHRYSSRQLHQLFRQFTEHRSRKRQLRRSELPHLWRWFPLAIMGRLMGRVLVFKAFKPVAAVQEKD
jgi:ubiquinone/menaquinone biosynthesis C-methylase UbiE